MSNDVKINRGLKGIYFERSGVSDIDGAAGTLSYRGYSIDDLATKSTFEVVAYLLIHANLPNAGELAAFDAALKAARTLRHRYTTLSPPVGTVIRWTCCAPLSRRWQHWNRRRCFRRQWHPPDRANADDRRRT